MFKSGYSVNNREEYVGRPRITSQQQDKHIVFSEECIYFYY